VKRWFIGAFVPFCLASDVSALSWDQAVFCAELAEEIEAAIEIGERTLWESSASGTWDTRDFFQSLRRLEDKIEAAQVLLPCPTLEAAFGAECLEVPRSFDIDTERFFQFARGNPASSIPPYPGRAEDWGTMPYSVLSSMKGMAVTLRMECNKRLNGEV